jgi:hypothetical protein
VYLQAIGVALGVGALVEQSIVVYSTLRLAGAVYLMCLGAQAIRQRRATLAADTESPPPPRTSAMVRRYSPATSRHSSPQAASSLPSFVMWPAFPASDYYEGSVPSRRQQPTTSLPASALAGRREGQRRDGSHVHHTPVDGGGAQLCPCSLATPTPQTFGVASQPRTLPGIGVDHQPVAVHC